METDQTSLSKSSVIVAFLLIVLSSQTPEADANPGQCAPSSCGNIHNISYPFRLIDGPISCVDPSSHYNLSCENNNLTVLHLYSGKYHVQAINYNSGTIRVSDPGLQPNNCSSIPRYSISVSNFSFQDPYNYFTFNCTGNPAKCRAWRPVAFFKCVNRLNSSMYVDTAPCINVGGSRTNLARPESYGYVKVGTTNVAELEDGCRVEWMAIVNMYENDRNASYQHIHDALVYGFELEWAVLDTDSCRGWSFTQKCYQNKILGLFPSLFQYIKEQRYAALLIIGGFFVARFILGTPFVIWFLIYKWRRRHLSMYSTIEDFLCSGHNFTPIRYSNSDIKKMTSKFKDKLGEGGYGCVFKGKLRSGRFVAIKMLGESKGNNGQDFVNEVSTIGRIHHVNVVQLVGYCAEGSKRALVYEFMPNGSLDKYIYSKEGCIHLSSKKIYEIALGAAQGIEYLHQGCDMQILHFDIKPHNILLDENFIPKVSDFGLAKLYPTDNSIVSLTAARGTMGYIAPELFYKNIGGVSYKADVYSFGMLLMEMASRRKNFNALVEHSSQIYFPSWVYDQYSEGRDLEMSDVTEEEKKLIKKMVLVALWCIQMKPSDRPSMSKVIEMLEGDVESIRMPEKPFLSLQDQMPVRHVQDNLNPTCSNELTLTLSAR